MTVDRYADLVRELERRAGKDAPILEDVRSILGPGGDVRSYFVRPQTLFDRDSVYESFTCYAVTASTLVIVFSDVSYEFSSEGEVLTTVQVVALDAIRDFQVLRRRALQGPGTGTLAALGMRLRWGGMWTSDAVPAGCDDPSCTADHGTIARIAGDDGEIVLDPSLDEETLAKGTVFIEELQSALMKATFA